MSRLCYEYEIRLSDCPSVMFVDCDHMVLQKVKICTTGWVSVLVTCRHKPSQM